MHAVSLVVTDLDGTLWHTDDVVHPRAVAALAELVDGPTPLMVATGRRVSSTRVPLARLDVAPAAVVLNGALGLHLATGDHFHLAPFAPADASRVLDGFEAAGLEPCVYVHGGTAEVWLSERPSTHPGHVRALAASAGVGDLRAVVAAEVVLAFSIIGAPHGSLVPVAEALAGVAEVHLDRALEYPRMAAITVAPRGRSKWDGVVAYCNAHGIDTTRILALGDGPNDVELLERAAISLVPENGHPSAQAHATHLIGSPSSGGWAAVLDHLG